MQPKRDPSDRRYWPARLGGIGKGFTTTSPDKQASPRYLGALNRTNSLSLNPLPCRMSDTAAKDAIATVSEDALKARARLLTIALLDDLDNARNSMDAKTLVDSLNATGKLAVDRASTVTVQGGIAHMHLDALREITQRATSRIASPDRAQPVDAQHVIAPSSAADDADSAGGAETGRS